MYYYVMYYREWVKGGIKTLILKLLANKNRSYGYQMRQEVNKLSLGNIKLTDGALYPALHKMESEGWLKSEIEYHGKRLRKYYSLTSLGEQRAEENIEAYFQFVRSMILVLTPTPN